jgi:hypothetical protein
VPPNLQHLSAGLLSFAEFLRIDDDLIAVAAEASPDRNRDSASRADLEAWIGGLSAKEKDGLLLRVIDGDDPHLGAELRQRFEREHCPTHEAREEDRRRTVGELLRDADAYAMNRRRQEAERKAREEAKREQALVAARKKHIMSKVECPQRTEELLDEILTDAYGDDEQLWALRQSFEDAVTLPADALVIGEPVEVLDIDYNGNSRLGLTARCRRQDGGEHMVAVFEVVFPGGSGGARHVAAYRKWLGLDPFVPPSETPTHRPKRHKATEDDLDLGAAIELVVLAPKEKAARCRILGTVREITMRSADVWKMVPGEIITVRARKQWRLSGHPYSSGDMESHRLDISALDLVPLRLEDEWLWDPSEEYWGEEGEPIEEWAKPIIARGLRPSFEMEQVLPGADPDDWDSDLILEAGDLNAAGDRPGTEKLLVEMLASDLRCLDAHAHLGSFAFDRRAEEAVRHYEVGVRIGELSLCNDFVGLLPWGRINNRPFLRCMHGFGLCLWRLGRKDEAAAIFERMLWLNPTDNQGIRFLLSEVRAGEQWEDHYDTKRR